MDLKLLLALTCTTLVCACTPSPAADNALTNPIDDVADIIAMPVEVETTLQDSISHFYQTTAVLEAPEKAHVVARVSGMVESIHVEEGEQVSAGQVLASIDPKRYRLALNKAQAELDVIDQELARMKAIANKQLVSQEAMAKLEFKRQSALADRDLAQLELHYSQVTSPIAGVVASRKVDRGNMATAMLTELYFIVQQQQLHGIIHLPEHEIANVNVGQLAKLEVDGTATHYNAKVLRIAPVVDSNSGTLKVTLVIDNSQHNLRSGMLARAKLQFDTHHNAIIMSRSALLRQDNGYSVFVVNGDMAEIRDVTLGFNDDGQVEVLTGLAAGDQVVIRGQHQLKDQTKVDIINPVRLAASK
ncbi:efflux RND transporter periplasmic adaptor subunit [Ferrimonas lipolytica]|uniref:Efflux RND transporter periplasmic adaptor subunit n=1 Tax=Ferrimonas lipolytica TaxID=2724191 RepID=A0A6H1UCR4_9GAMM|nr:efflux RND transporter periplasmic adaptor subunit [Ferrimonas lipolytica]QIZ75996.1 efflux RND transporter periplasmic adaptor subunit [Ferrimonas lipolytica]